MNKYINDSKHSHQLYFFTNEAQEIRTYFSGLLFINNNNNNDHQINNLFNYEKLTHKISILTEKSSNHKIINQMIKTDDALKIIIALLFKGFSWMNELTNSFNISKKLYVKNTLWTLQKLNLLIKEKGERINPYFYEALEKSKSMQIKKVLHQCDIYYITKDFIKFCSLLKELFEYKINQSETFRFSLREIVLDTEIFKKKYDIIMKEELNLLQRTKKTNKGLIYYTQTIRYQLLNKIIKETLIEIKLKELQNKEKQQLLTNKEKKYLTLIKKNTLSTINELENKQFINKKPKTYYNGKEINGINPIEQWEKQNELIGRSKTIIGRPEMINEKTFFDNGLFVLEKGKRMRKNDLNKKTPNEELNDFFSSYNLNK